MSTLSRLRLFRGDTLTGLVESFIGFTDLDFGPPSGPAGGDLGSTYPDPTVVALHSGATRLPVGAVADGQFLKRVGGNLVGAAVPSPPVPVQAQYNGNNVNIGDGNTNQVPWNTHQNGADLIDISDPDFPAAKVAGLYIVAAIVLPGAQLTVGGSYEAHLTLAGHESIQTSSPKTVNLDSPDLYTTCTVAAVLGVGDGVNLSVANDDGAVTRPFRLFRASVAVMPT